MTLIEQLSFQQFRRHFTKKWSPSKKVNDLASVFLSVLYLFKLRLSCAKLRSSCAKLRSSYVLFFCPFVLVVPLKSNTFQKRYENHYFNKILTTCHISCVFIKTSTKPWGVLFSSTMSRYHIPMDPSTFLGSVWNIIHYNLEA